MSREGIGEQARAQVLVRVLAQFEAQVLARVVEQVHVRVEEQLWDRVRGQQDLDRVREALR